MLHIAPLVDHKDWDVIVMMVNQMWVGIWPGIMECYLLKLICFDTATNKCFFDLNEWYINKSKYDDIILQEKRNIKIDELFE